MELIKNKIFLLMLFSGLISVLAFAPFNHSYIIVLSLLVLMWVINDFAPTMSKWKIIFYAYIYGLAYFNTQLYWIFYSLYKVINAGLFVSIIAIIGFTAFLATYIVLAIYIYSRIKAKSALFNNILLFPGLWVFFEWLRGWFLSGFPWCELGYTQVNNSFFRGFYPLIGNYGVSFLLLSLTGALFSLIRAKYLKLSGSRVRLVVIYGIGVFIVGALIQDNLYTQPFGRPIKVAILQGNVSEGVKWSEQHELDIYKGLVQQAQADLILIPETAIAQFEENLPAGYLATLAKIAKDKKAELVVGIPKIIDEQDDYVNAAMLVTKPNHPYYAKSHLVPYGEYIPARWLLGPIYKSVALPMVGFTAGSAYQAPIVAANQKLAFNICYENGFNAELIKAAADATLMVNLSDMVWYGKTIAKDEHLQLSQVRALENQRYYIQATNTGISAIIRPDGKIQAQLPIFERVILQDYVGGRIGVTPFERYGNWLIILWVSLVLFITVIYRVYQNFKTKTIDN